MPIYNKMYVIDRNVITLYIFSDVCKLSIIWLSYAKERSYGLKKSGIMKQQISVTLAFNVTCLNWSEICDACFATLASPLHVVNPSLLFKTFYEWLLIEIRQSIQIMQFAAFTETPCQINSNYQNLLGKNHAIFLN